MALGLNVCTQTIASKGRIENLKHSPEVTIPTELQANIKQSRNLGQGQELKPRLSLCQGIRYKESSVENMRGGVIDER